MNASPIDAFRAMHESGCFVLPNPWDIGGAIYLERLGYRALATTSAGLAFSRGRPDAIAAVPLDDVLAHTREIVGATALPVNADFQEGYAVEPEGVARNVVACLDTGAAGLSIEDSSGDPDAPLFERELAIERIASACTARDDSVPAAVITARCEAWLVGDPTPERTAIDRLVAFADAGADCLFAPGVTDPQTIAEIVAAVAPKPVNVLVAAPHPELTVARLADLGVRRVSVGSAFARIAWGAFMRAAKSIAETDEFGGLDGAASFAELNGVFGS